MMYIIRRQTRILYRNYSVENFRKEKIKNKIELQEELGLAAEP